MSNAPRSPRFQFGLRRLALSISLFAVAAACLHWMGLLQSDPDFRHGWIVFFVGSTVMVASLAAAVSVLFGTSVWGTIRVAMIGAGVMLLLMTLLIVILVILLTSIS